MTNNLRGHLAAPHRTHEGHQVQESGRLARTGLTVQRGPTLSAAHREGVLLPFLVNV